MVGLIRKWSSWMVKRLTILNMSKFIERIVKVLVGVMMLATFSGCGSEDEPDVTPVSGYFRTLMGLALPAPVDFDAGKIEIELTGTKSETVIPLVLIANEEDDIHKTRYTWETKPSQGEALLPDLQYTAEGYVTYPNTLDYTYKFKWATFSTVKEPGSEKGVLRVSYEANPYNVPRQIVAYLRNEDSGTLILRQEKNPDGVDPPGEPLEEWECYIGPYFPLTD